MNTDFTSRNGNRNGQHNYGAPQIAALERNSIITP